MPSTILTNRQKPTGNVGARRPVQPDRLLRFLRWSVIAGVGLTILAVLIAVFPDVRKEAGRRQPPASANGLTAFDRLEGRTAPRANLPRTVAYEGRIGEVRRDGLTLQLSNGRSTQLALSNSTEIKQAIVSAQPVRLSPDNLKPGLAVTVLAEAPDGRGTALIAQKIIVTNVSSPLTNPL